MDPKILRRAVIAYTVYLGILLGWALVNRFHFHTAAPDIFFRKTAILVYLTLELIFLRDLIFRRSLSPAEQYRWVAGFLVFHIFAFWRYYIKFVKPEQKTIETEV